MSSRDKIFVFWSMCPIGFERFKSILITDGWQLYVAGTGSNLAELGDYPDRIVCLGILGEQFLSTTDLKQIQSFLDRGNSLIVTANADGRPGVTKRDINQLLGQYGIKFNRDCVIRPNPYKLYHPREALLEDYIVNRGLSDVMKKYTNKSTYNEDTLFDDIDVNQIIYASGCTLTVSNKISTIMMTSSKLTIPSCQALCAFHGTDGFGPRIVAIGSTEFVNDTFITDENNESLFKSLLEFAQDRTFPVNIGDAKTVEISVNNNTPDVSSLIEMQIPCMRETEPLPEDNHDLLDARLFTLDQSNLTKVHRAYEDLGVPRTRLTLIKPRIQLRPYDLKPAIHGFVLMHASSDDMD